MIAFCYFFSELTEDFECRWLCFNNSWVDKLWPKHEPTFGKNQINKNIFDYNSCVQFLSTSDIIIYQANRFNIELCKIHAKIDSKEAVLTPVFVNDLDYMKKKEAKYQCSISAVEIIENTKDTKSLYLKSDNHLTTCMSMKIIKRLCNNLSIPFFTDEQYNKIIKQQYPYWNWNRDKDEC